MKTPSILSMTAQQYSEQVALRTMERSVTYAAWDAWAWGMAQALQARGLSRGQRVLILARPSVQQIVALTAMIRAGLVFAPVSPRFPGTQIKDMARQVSASLCLYDSEYSRKLPCGIPLLSLDTLMAEATLFACSSVPIAEVSMDQEVTLVWTSGSSRSPKAALHLYGNHYHSALGSNQNIRLEPGDHWLLSLPMFHVAGIAVVMRALLAGACVDIPAAEASLTDSLLTFRPTHLSLVATQLVRLLQEGEDVLSVLQQAKAILLGGSAIPDSLLREAERLGLPVFVSYGSTEMASQITTTRPGDGLEQWRRAGHLLPFRELRIAEDGEIRVRGATRCAGYLTADGLTAPFDAEGWFPTGDLGQWEEDGALRVIGRKDAMFISGGENIQPEEIEWALEQHQDVQQAIVVDIPDPEFGARPHVFVQMKEGRTIQPDNLITHLQAYVATFKIPDSFHPWPVECLSDRIKVSRYQLRQILCDTPVSSTVSNADS